MDTNTRIRRLCDRLGIQYTGNAIDDLVHALEALIDRTGTQVAYRRVWDSKLKAWVKDKTWGSHASG